MTGAVGDAASTAAHKAFTVNIIKRLSPHIEHFDSSINGYAIAEFTEKLLTWTVYDVDKTECDAFGKSTRKAKREVSQEETYDPVGIKLGRDVGDTIADAAKGAKDAVTNVVDAIKSPFS